MSQHPVTKPILGAAEEIMRAMMEGTDVPSNPEISDTLNPKIKQMDIKDVNVPDDFNNLILESSFGIKAKVQPKPIVRKVIEAAKPVRLEEKAQNLVTEFSSLLSRAKQIIDELTTCGMIGANTASKPKPKVNPIKKLLKR